MSTHGPAALRAMDDALDTHDIERVREHLTTRVAVLAIGTGDEELVEDREALIADVEQRFADAPDLRFEAGEMSWQVLGDVGWIAERPTLVMPDGTRPRARRTAVPVRGSGLWRMAQSHVSLPSPDDPVPDPPS